MTDKVQHNLALEGFKELPILKPFDEEPVIEMITPTTQKYQYVTYGHNKNYKRKFDVFK